MPKAESWWEASTKWRTTKAFPPSDSATASPWSYLGPQSKPTHGGAGRVNRVRIDPLDENHWYACTPAGGLWHSQDAGEHWSVLGVDVLAPLGVTDVWIDPTNTNHLWLATGDGNGGDTYSIGLLETWDGGLSWSPLELEFEPNQGRRIHAIAPHPTNQDVFFVGSDIGAFKTSDGGGTFSLLLPGEVRDLAWMNDSLVIAAVANQGIFVSEDEGSTWTQSTLPEANNSVGRIQLAPQDWGGMTSRDTIYAVAGHYFQQSFLAFWKSVDAGQTWTAEITRLTGPNLLGYTLSGADNGGQAFWDLCISVDPTDAQRVLVGGVNVWETHDGGDTWNCPIHWQGALESSYAHADQHGMTFLSNGAVVLANDGGVYRWDDDGVVDLSADLRIAQGYAIGLHPEKAKTWILGTQDNGTNLSTPEFEARVLDGDGFHGFFDPNLEGRLYASAYYGMLYRSDDGGRTMTNIANYFQSTGPSEIGSWQTPFEMHPGVPGRIVAAKKSLHYSDDGGSSWTSVGGMGTVRSTAMALSPSHVDVALVAKNAALYWKAANATEFVQITGPASAQIGDVAIDSTMPNIWWVSLASYDENNQVWCSPDGGETWENRSAGLPSLPIHCLLQLDNGDWICGSDLGVHHWNEQSGVWEDLGSGLPLTPVVDLAADWNLNRIVASTYGRGAWQIQREDAPAVHPVIVSTDAEKTQCLDLLQGTPVMVNAGSVGLSEMGYIIAAQQNGTTVSDTLMTMFESPVAPNEEAELNPFSISVPSPGMWSIAIQPWLPNEGGLTTPFESALWSSGLGHTTTLQWWGDCENVDMRWELWSVTTNEEVLQSLPLAAGDSIAQSLCLSEGCYEITWNDSGSDGFSGEDCGGPGGFRLAGPFGDVWSEANGTNFGNEYVVPFCIDVPWCFADYNGDGTRSVQDLLTILSDFGCTSNCVADNSLDGMVGVSDLMNMLSVYGSGCEPD